MQTYALWRNNLLSFLFFSEFVIASSKIRRRRALRCAGGVSWAWFVWKSCRFRAVWWLLYSLFSPCWALYQRSCLCGGLKPSLKFFIDFVCNEADAGLNAPFGEVKYRPCLQFAFDDPEGPLHAPKFMVMLDDLLRRQVSVGDIAFQSVPSRILCDFVLVYAYMDVILNHQELIVSTLVDVLLVDFPDA